MTQLLKSSEESSTTTFIKAQQSITSAQNIQTFLNNRCKNQILANRFPKQIQKDKKEKKNLNYINQPLNIITSLFKIQNSNFPSFSCQSIPHHKTPCRHVQISSLKNSKNILPKQWGADGSNHKLVFYLIQGFKINRSQTELSVFHSSWVTCVLITR